MSYTDVQHQLMYAKVLTELTLASEGMDSVATTMPLITGDGAKLRATATYGLIQAVVWDSTSYGSPLQAFLADAAEVIMITDYSTGDSTTIARAQDGTTARDFNTAGKAYKVALIMGESTFEYLAKPPYYESYLPNLIPNLSAPYDLPTVYSNSATHLVYPVGGGIEGSAISFPANILYAMPDSEEAGAVIRGLKVRKNTGFSLSVKVGIYSNTTLNGNTYPGTLLGQDSKTNDSTASVIFITGDFPITVPYVRQLRWFVVLFASSASCTTIDQTEAFRNYLGWVHLGTTAIAPIVGVTHAFTYDTLPDTFPSSAPGLIAPAQTVATFPFMTKIYQSLT